MAEDEVSVNKMEKEPGAQELSTWMKKRLDDRAKPFSPQGLIELLLNGSKLAKSVVKHAGITDVLSRIKNLGFLSKSYRNIIARADKAESPNIYKMIDLPWFRGGGDEAPAQRRFSHSYAQEKSVSRVIKIQPSEPSIESLAPKKEKDVAYIARLMQPPISRKTTITFGNTIGPNPVKGSPSGIEKKPRAYPTRLAELVKNESEIKTGTPSDPADFNKINEPQDIPKTSGHQPSHADAPAREAVKPSHTTPSEARSRETIRQTGNVDKGNSFGITIDKVERTNTGRRNTGTGYVGDEKREIRLIENPTKSPYSEQSSKAIQPISMPPAPSEKEIVVKSEPRRLSNIFNLRTKTNNDVKLDTAQYQETKIDEAVLSTTPNSTTRNNLILPDNQPTNNTRTIYTEQGSSSKDTTHEANEKLADNKMENAKPSVARQKLGSTEPGQRYPAQELVYKKPLSIGQKIMQSLPLLRNIKRKDEKTTLKPAPLINKKPADMKDSLSLKEIDLVYTNREQRETTDIPEKSTNTKVNAGMASMADVVVLPQPGISNDSTIRTNYLPGEVHKIINQTVLHESIKRKEASQIYPVKDLVPVRMHPTGQRLVRALPLIRNWSKNNLLVSRANKKLIESSGTQQSGSVLEIPREPEITAAHYTPALFPPNFPTVADNDIADTNVEVPQSVLQKLPDFNRSSNNREMDLVLSSANQTKTTRHREDNQPLDLLIQMQRDQSHASSLSTVRTQLDQTQTQNTTQTSTTQNVENNTNQNNNQPDIKALAREIYPLIRRMIIIEKERRPSL